MKHLKIIHRLKLVHTNLLTEKYQQSNIFVKNKQTKKPIPHLGVISGTEKRAKSIRSVICKDDLNQLLYSKSCQKCSSCRLQLSMF